MDGRCASLARANDARMKQSRNPASSGCAGLDHSWLPFTISSHINCLGEEVVASWLNAFDDAMQLGYDIC
jgi:hypothetical protein